MKKILKKYTNISGKGRSLKDLYFMFFVIIVTMAIFFTSTLKSQSLHPIKPYFTQEFVKGRILDVIEERIEEDPIVHGRYLGSQRIRVKLLQGRLKDEVFVINNTLSKRHNILARNGMTAIFTVRESNGSDVVWLYNYKRSHYTHLLVASFFLLILVLGGIKGFKSILSLVFTAVMIVYVLIPLLFAGYEPIPIAIMVVSFIIFISFFLIGGINHKSLTAIFGTLFGIITAGILSYVFGQMAQLNGVNMERGEQVLYLAQDYQIKIKGLMFISILIASLGAIMDVSMSIASAASELVSHNNDIKELELFKSLMNIGRDITGTMTNTLILAFAGSSLTLIMMIWGYQMTYMQFMNIPTIAIEAIQAFSGSIGIVLTVPFTAITAVIALKYKRRKCYELEKVSS